MRHRSGVFASCRFVVVCIAEHRPLVSCFSRSLSHQFSLTVKLIFDQPAEEDEVAQREAGDSLARMKMDGRIARLSSLEAQFCPESPCAFREASMQATPLIGRTAKRVISGEGLPWSTARFWRAELHLTAISPFWRSACSLLSLNISRSTPRETYAPRRPERNNDVRLDRFRLDSVFSLPRKSTYSPPARMKVDRRSQPTLFESLRLHHLPPCRSRPRPSMVRRGPGEGL